MSDEAPALGLDGLAQLIADSLDARLRDVHVCMPGYVVSYDSVKSLAVVQPAFTTSFVDGTKEALPSISNVPVAFPRFNGGFIHFPLQKDDPVTLVFSERALELWLSNGGVADPGDPRTHDLSDAIAVPGGASTANPISGLPNSKDLVLKLGSSTLQLQTGGTFLMKGAGGKEVFDLVDQLLSAMIAAKTITLMGPSPFYAATLATLTQIQTDWRTLKGT